MGDQIIEACPKVHDTQPSFYLSADSTQGAPTRPLMFGNGESKAAAPRSEDGVTARSCRVLIVEDEALVALDMAMILNAAGYQVMGTKPTGDSALLALEAAAADGILPDVVLMDIALRGNIDGIETTIQIKNRYQGVPVAFITGQADPITRARAESTQPAGYLLKPFTPEQLVNFIRTLLSRA